MYAVFDSYGRTTCYTESLREAWESRCKNVANGWRGYVINPDNIDYDCRDGLTDDERLQIEEWDCETL